MLGSLYSFPRAAALAMALVAWAMLRTYRRDRRPDARAELLTLACVFALALTMRFAFGPWETLHGNGQGPWWIESLYRDDVFAKDAYGPGYQELYGGLARLSGRYVEEGVFVANGILSALTATAGVALARAVGLRLRVAALIGVVLALDPISIRISTTEAYLVPIAFGVIVAACLVAQGANVLRAGSLFYLVYFVAAGLVATWTARIHQSAWPALSIVPFIVFAGPRSSPPNKYFGLREPDILAASIAGAVIALVIFVLSGSTLLAPLHSTKSVAKLPNVFPLLGALVLTLPAMLTRRWRQFAWAGVPLIPAAFVLLATVGIYTPAPLFCFGYCTLFVPLLVVPAATFLSTRRRILPLGGALAAGIFVVVSPFLAPLPTDGQENRLVRAFVRNMPTDCELLYVGAARNQRLGLPHYAGRRIGEPLPGRELNEQTEALSFISTHCRYYYRGSLCSTDDGATLCERLENSAAMLPVTSWSVSARPSMRRRRYLTDPIQVGIFAVEQPTFLVARQPIGSRHGDFACSPMP